MALESDSFVVRINEISLADVYQELLVSHLSLACNPKIVQPPCSIGNKGKLWPFRVGTVT